MKFIDTHAHIYANQFKADLDDALDRATSAGIDRIYMPNIDSKSIGPMLALEERDPERYIPTMGIHPCYIKEGFEKELQIAEEWLRKRKFAAVGEIGIDLHWDKTTLDIQIEAFKIQIGWAKELELPIIIHARESLEEIFEVIDQEIDDRLMGVFHCFSGNADQAKRVLEYGFYLGIGGVSTFKNGGLDKVLPETGLEKLVLETDCPYLAPVPHRGKRNEPSYVPLIADRVSDLTEQPIEVVAEVTTQNALKLFKDLD